MEMKIQRRLFILEQEQWTCMTLLLLPPTCSTKAEFIFWNQVILAVRLCVVTVLVFNDASLIQLLGMPLQQQRNAGLFYHCMKDNVLFFYQSY